MISTAGRYAACNGNSYSALPEGRSFISAGTQTRTGGELKIKDLGMQGSKLVIVAAEITDLLTENILEKITESHKSPP